MAQTEAEAAEAMLAKLTKDVTEAFDIFDHEKNKAVDVREIGTIVRSLGCCPSEGELHDLLAEMEEEDVGNPSGFIRFDKYFPVITKILMQRRFKAASEDKLMRAFEALDKDQKGFLTAEELTKYLTTEGEPFTEEEMDEMLTAAVDPDKDVIVYKEYVPMMVAED